MINSFVNSPFYPSTGSGQSSPFRIQTFTNNREANEMGIPVTNVGFNWSYLAGPPTSQTILPLPGVVNPASATSFNLTGVSIENDTRFVLTATDGIVSRNASTWVRFYYPMFIGNVVSELPVEVEILATEKRVRPTENFRRDWILDDERMMIAVHSDAPQPIAVRESIFGFDMLGSFNIFPNTFLNTPAGLQSYTVYIWSWIQVTMGLPMTFDVIFN